MRAALSLLVVCVVVAGGCSDTFGNGVRGSGTPATESRAVESFSSVVVIASGTVLIDVDGTEAVTITADDNLLPLLSTAVAGDRLELRPTESISPSREIEYRIDASSLDEVAIRGSGDITASPVESAGFRVVISGSGEVTLRGTADDLEVEISGSGSYRGADLVAATGSVDISGSGSAVMNVTDQLDISISGSGEVEYIGTPALSQSISGSGEVTSR